MEQFRVFARSEYAEPLEFQGMVAAADGAAAALAAVEQFGRGWVELTLVPERSICWILRPEPAGAAHE